MRQVAIKTLFEVIMIIIRFCFHCTRKFSTHSEDDDFLDKWALHESEWLHEKATDCIPLSLTWLVTTRTKRFYLVISFWHSATQMLNFKNQHHICTQVFQAANILVAMETLKKVTVIKVTEFAVLILSWPIRGRLVAFPQFQLWTE